MLLRRNPPEVGIFVNEYPASLSASQTGFRSFLPITAVISFISKAPFGDIVYALSSSQRKRVLSSMSFIEMFSAVV